jgi:hypothetical protein
MERRDAREARSCPLGPRLLRHPGSRPWAARGSTVTGDSSAWSSGPGRGVARMAGRAAHDAVLHRASWRNAASASANRRSAAAGGTTRLPSRSSGRHRSHRRRRGRAGRLLRRHRHCGLWPLLGNGKGGDGIESRIRRAVEYGSGRVSDRERAYFRPFSSRDAPIESGTRVAVSRRRLSPSAWCCGRRTRAGLPFLPGIRQRLEVRFFRSPEALPGRPVVRRQPVELVDRLLALALLTLLAGLVLLRVGVAHRLRLGDGGLCLGQGLARVHHVLPERADVGGEPHGLQGELTPPLAEGVTALAVPLHTVDVGAQFAADAVHVGAGLAEGLAARGEQAGVGLRDHRVERGE